MIAKKLFRKKVAVSPRAFTLEPRTFAPLCILASRPQVKKYSPSERLKIKPHVKQFSTSTALNDGIIPVMGDNSKSVDKADQSLLQAAQISTEDYEEIANKTMDDLSSTLEEVQEQKGNLDTEYSSGILKIEIPNRGTWIINKQPPNKQIWLSSPESGPKRFDWVITGESMHQKEGSGSGDWIYLRDGTSLSSVMNKELGIKTTADIPSK